MSNLNYTTLENYIKRRSTKDGSVEVTITPDVAQLILDIHRPKFQRGLKGKRKDFIEAMLEGDWSVTGDTIKFTREGDLIDGQHRLRACTEAGVPFTTHVIFGVNGRSFYNMDWVNQRGKEDVFVVNDVPNGPIIAKAVAWLLKYEDGDARKRSTPRPAKLLDIFQARYGDKLSILAPAAVQAHKRTGYPVGHLLAVFYLASRSNPKKAREFVQAWVTGEEKGRRKHLRVNSLLDRVTRIRVEGHRVHDATQLGWLIELWNHFVTQQTGRPQFNFSMTAEHPRYPDVM